jgi:hypothetical protein
MHREQISKEQKAVEQAVRKHNNTLCFADQDIAKRRHACVAVCDVFKNGDDYLNMICIELMIENKLDQSDLYHDPVMYDDHTKKPLSGLLVSSAMFEVPGIEGNDDWDQNDNDVE